MIELLAGRIGGRWMILTKAVLAVSLTVGIGWVALISYQYADTKNPISRLPALPPPIADLLREPPEYYDSVYGVSTPLGIAVGGDHQILVTESSGERMIRSFDSLGNQLGAFAPEGTVALSRIPLYVAVGPEGKIYVSDRESMTIYIFTPDGSPAGEVESPFADGWQPLGLSFDRQGNLYVTEVTPGKHRVLVLAPDGSLKLEFGREGGDEGEFYFPNDVAVDEQGWIYVSDGNNGRVQLFDQEGIYIGAIARGMSDGNLSLPRGIAIDDDLHMLFVVDASRGAVQVYDISERTPRFLHAFGDDGNPISSLAYPNDIALDGEGQAFVTDRENGRVQIWRY